jgi:hypothetical protein
VRAVAILALGAALAAPAVAQANVPPRIGVVSTTDARLVVRGTAFAPGERLLVRLAGRGVTTKRVVADGNGSFRTSLVKPPPQTCGRYFLSVRRASGKSVGMRLGPGECANPADVGN